jgi:iron(III) transport system ATP-binding protein
MNHGVVGQIGTPVEVYMEPRTLFVARFVGQMNVLPARATGRADVARVGDVALRHRPGAGATDGAPVMLAIRPEELVIGAAARKAENALVARVAGVQFLGAFTRLSLTLGGDEPTRLECDVAAGALDDVGAKEGGELALALPPAALRVFPGA